MIMKQHGVLPYNGGFMDQSIGFVQFCYLAMGSEGKENKASLRRMKLKKK